MKKKQTSHQDHIIKIIIISLIMVTLLIIGSYILGSGSLPESNRGHNKPISSQKPNLQGSPVTFRDLDLMQGSQKNENKVIRNQQDWRAFWTEITTPSTALPDIDFAQDMIIAVSSGAGGPSDNIRVESVSETGTAIHVTTILEKIEPAEGCNSLAIVSYPSSIVAVPFNIKPVLFTNTIVHKTGDCR